MSTNQENFYAYLAGLLDGDGSIYVRAKPNSSYRYGYQIAPYVAFFQKATDTNFSKLMERIGYGRLRIRNDEMYEFTINKQAELVDFLDKVKPFLFLKRLQADLLLEILEDKKKLSSQQDFTKMLKKIDYFRELNYSKRRKTRY